MVARVQLWCCLLSCVCLSVSETFQYVRQLAILIDAVDHFFLEFKIRMLDTGDYIGLAREWNMLGRPGCGVATLRPLLGFLFGHASSELMYPCKNAVSFHMFQWVYQEGNIAWFCSGWKDHMISHTHTWVTHTLQYADNDGLIPRPEVSSIAMVRQCILLKRPREKPMATVAEEELHHKRVLRSWGYSFRGWNRP